MKKLKKGDRVRIKSHVPWPNDCTGTVTEPPEVVKQLVIDQSPYEGCCHTLHTLKGPEVYAWIEFDFPQPHGFGCCVSGGGEVSEKYLSRLKETKLNCISRAKVLNQKGLSLIKNDQFKKALDVLQKSHKIYKNFNCIYGMATVNHNIGLAFRKNDDLDQALKHYRETIQSYEQYKDFEHLATANGSIAMIYSHKKDWDTSLIYFNKCLEALEKAGNQHKYALNCGNIGQVLVNKGELDQALEYFYKCYDYFKGSNEIDLLIKVLRDIESVHKKKGDYDKASECSNEILRWEKQK